MFLAPDWKDPESIQLYTDASGSFGFGAYLDGAWFRDDWQQHQKLPERSIQWQELFTVVAAALTWGHRLAGQRIRYHCDNLPIVQGLDQPVLRAPGSDGTSKNPVLYRSPTQFHILPRETVKLCQATIRNRVLGSGTPPRQSELYCGCTFTQSNVTYMYLCPCTPGQLTPTPVAPVLAEL